MNGWTFLVARGRRKGYRTVLAPDFLVVRNLHSLLSTSAGGDSAEVGGRRSVEIDNREVGQLSLVYRTEQLRPGDLGGLDEDDKLVLDEHGRPLELLYGVVSRHQPPGGVDEHDLQRAREEAFGSYRHFLAEEDTFQIDVSTSFSLRGSEVPIPRTEVDAATSYRPSAAEVATPADGRVAGVAAGSPPAKARQRKVGFGGAAVIAGAMLVALLFLWRTLPDRIVDVEITVQPGDGAGCAQQRTLMGTITGKETSKVMYHWEGPGFTTASVPLGRQTNIEVDVPNKSGGGGVRTGVYFLVIDQPEELRQKVDQMVRCKE